MTATLDKLEYLGRRMWRATASSTLGSPTFRWYYQGALIRSETTGQIDFRADGVVPHVEVRDDAAAPAQAAHPGQLVLTWYAAPGTSIARFEIEKESSPGSGTWSRVARIGEDGRGYYEHRTDWFDDDTAHSYRVRAFDAAGNAATVAAHQALIVRHPDVPRWTATRNNDATLTLSAA